jgi:hypothetical protein
MNILKFFKQLFSKNKSVSEKIDVKDKNMDILKVEKDILKNLDNLEELFNEYEKL